MSDEQRLEHRLSEMLDATRERAREPLPRVVEERVLARLRGTMSQPSRPRMWLLLATGLVTATIVGVFVRATFATHTSLAVVAQVGQVVIAPKLGSVTTSAQARALLALPLARVAVLADTSTTFPEVVPKRVHLTLSQGSLVAHIEPNHAERTFTVTLPNAEVVVTGTVLYLAAGGGRSQVAVERGHVMVRRVSRDGTRGVVPESVSAGEVIEIGTDGFTRRALRAEEGAAMLASLQVATWQTPEVETLARGLAVPEQPLDVLPSLEPQPAPPLPAGSRISGRHPQLGKHDTVVKQPSSGSPALLALGDCTAARAALETRQRPADETSRAWFEVAQCFNEFGDLSAALAAYREVVRRFPAAVVSENSVYEIARLSRELHRNDDAEAAFADYVARYPKGALAQEAYFWRCHMAANNGHIDTALSCLRAFRERFPKSGRVSDTNFSEATLLRTTKHDCQGAISAYDRYLQSPGDHREQAEQWRAWCEARLH